MRKLSLAALFACWSNCFAGDVVIICPAEIRLDSGPIAVIELPIGYQASLSSVTLKLDYGSFYRGPPELRAQLIGDKPPTGSIGAWTLNKIPPEIPVVDERFLDFWAVCSYGDGLVKVSKKVEGDNLSRCLLKEFRPLSRRGKKAHEIGFFCN